MTRKRENENGKLTAPSNRRIHRRGIASVEPALVRDRRRRRREDRHRKRWDGSSGGIRREGRGTVPWRERSRRPWVGCPHGRRQGTRAGSTCHLCCERCPW